MRDLAPQLVWGMRAPVLERPEITTWAGITSMEAITLRRHAEGRRVIEVGSAYGFSTAVLASVAEIVWAIDPHNVAPGHGNYDFPDDPPAGYENTLQAMTQMLDALGLRDRVEIIRESSDLALGEGFTLPPLFSSPNMAFIDGDHSYRGCITDLHNCERLIGPGGIMCVHDYRDARGDCAGVAEAVDEWRGERPVQVIDTMATIRL